MSSNTVSCVSVVIPCYNHARYLPQAIESALAQTYPPVEVIVVNDGSTDDTPQVAARYEPLVRLIQQENRGLSAARNTGIQAAAGEYVAFLDADDLWLPEFLVTLAPLLNADPTLGAAYSGCRFIDAAGSPLPQTTTRVVPPSLVHDALVDGDFFPAHAVLVRRTCFERVGLFDETLRASEDWDMWLRLAAEYPMVGTPQIVALYRMHGDNMSANLARMHESQMAVCRKHFGPAEGDPVTWPAERRRAYAGVYFWRTLAHYRREEPSLGQEYFGQALATSPAMAGEVDTFYALGCADQPLGYMGDLAHLDLERSASRVLDALHVVFINPRLSDELKARRRLAHGTAYLALGLLAYGGGCLALARSYFVQAAWWQPALLTNREWTFTFAKTLLGDRLLDLVRRLSHGRSAGN